MKSDEIVVQCEGYRRYGGAFSFGPPTWQRCVNAALVSLTVRQKSVTEVLPACNVCWKEALENKGVEVLNVMPL